MTTPPRKPSRTRAAALDERALDAFRLLKTSIRPIYRKSGARFELCATALLLRIDNRDLIVSAAHVLDDVSEGQLFIAASDYLQPLGGCCARSPLPASGKRDDDVFDYGFLLAEKLPPLEGCVFLQEEFLVPNVRSLTPLTAIGYPSSRNRGDPTRLILKLKPLIFTNAAKVCPPKLQAKGFKNTTHVFVPYHRRKLRAGATRVMGPPHRGMRGISGGGIWWLGRSAADHPRLAALTIELPENPPLIVGTRTAVLLKNIKKALGELSC